MWAVFAKVFLHESMWSLYCNFPHYANFITLCTSAYVQACECPISFKNRAVNNTGNYVMWWNSINVEELHAQWGEKLLICIFWILPFHETFVVLSKLCLFTKLLYFQNFVICNYIRSSNGKCEKKSREILGVKTIQMLLNKGIGHIVTNLGLSSDFPLLKMPDKDCRACNNCAKPRCDAQLTPLFRYMLAWKNVILPRKKQDEKCFNNKKKNQVRIFAKNPQGQILRQIVSVTIDNLPNFGLMP